MGSISVLVGPKTAVPLAYINVEPLNCAVVILEGTLVSVWKLPP